MSLGPRAIVRQAVARAVAPFRRGGAEIANAAAVAGAMSPKVRKPTQLQYFRRRRGGGSQPIEAPGRTGATFEMSMDRHCLRARAGSTPIGAPSL